MTDGCLWSPRDGAIFPSLPSSLWQGVKPRFRLSHSCGSLLRFSSWRMFRRAQNESPLESPGTVPPLCTLQGPGIHAPREERGGDIWCLFGERGVCSMNSTAMRTGRLTDESALSDHTIWASTLCEIPQKAGNLQNVLLAFCLSALAFPFTTEVEAERPFLNALGSTYKFPLSSPLWCSSYLVLGSLLHC